MAGVSPRPGGAVRLSPRMPGLPVARVELDPEMQKRLANVEKRREKDATEMTAKIEQSDGVFVRPQIVGRYVFGENTRMELFEYAGVEKCDGAPMINGIPGNNITSLLSAGYFSKSLKLPVVGGIRVRGAEPSSIVQENVPSLSYRLFGDSRLVVLMAEDPIKSGPVAYNVTLAIIDFCKRRRISHLFNIDGIPSRPDEMEDAERLRFCTSDPAFSRHMKSLNHLAMMNMAVGGMAGQVTVDAVHAEGMEQTHVSLILAKADARLPSAKPAVLVVRALDKFLDRFELDLTELEDSALEMEVAIGRVVREATERMAPQEAPRSMYM